MKLNKAGIDLIKSYEGCKLKAYPDPGSGREPWTIGYGATGPHIERGLVWTQAQADARLAEDLLKFCSVLTPMIKHPLTDNQFSAVVSLVYNIGPGNFKKSEILRYLNIGDISAAGAQFPLWNKASGKVLNGLTRRRSAELKLFQTA